MKIKGRIIVLVSSTLLVFAIALGITLKISLNSLLTNLVKDVRKELMKGYKTQLKNLTETGLSVIVSLDKMDIPIEQKKQRAIAVIKNMIYDSGSNYIFALDSKGTVQSHINQKLIGKTLWDQKDSKGKYLFREVINSAKSNGGGGYTTYYWTKPGENGVFPKLTYSFYFQKWDWVIGTGVYVDDVDKEVAILANQFLKQENSMLLIMLVIMIIVVVIGILAAFITAKAIVSPILKVRDSLKEMSQGQGDLTKQIDINSKDEAGELAKYFNTFLESLRSMVSKIVESMHQLLTATEEISQGNQDLSSRVDRQSALLEESASSIEEMTSNLKEIADTASHSNAQSQEIRIKTNNGKDQIENATRSIENTNQETEKIREIVKIIDSISFQTNILALNAAVEAARAKEHGKGFAVVANEVRNLAQKSSENSKKIETMILNIISSIEDGSHLVEQSKVQFLEIDQDIQLNSENISRLSSGASEQSLAIEEVNSSITQLDEITQNNASLVEEIAASAEELEGQTREVLDMLQFFKV